MDPGTLPEQKASAHEEVQETAANTSSLASIF